MSKSFKVNTAILICTAFVFKLLFVNIGVISSLNTKQNTRFVKAHISALKKRRRHSEPLNNSGNCEYSVVEIYEEDPNNDEFKSNPFFLIQVLYSLAARKAENNLTKLTLSSKYFSDIPLHRYLTFHVFRI
jgi:hypothetical protein